MHSNLKTIFSIILFFSSSLIFAQSAWVLQPSGTTTDLNSIYATSPTDVYAVGNNGVARITSNGGISWSSMNIGSSQTHYRIKFYSGLLYGAIVGVNQEILHTSDAGATWTNAVTGIGTGTSTLYDFNFTTGVSGWAVGGSTYGPGFVFNTQNSQTIYTPGTFCKAVRGFANGRAVGDGGLIFYNVSGNNWTVQPSGTTNQLNKIASATNSLTRQTNTIAVGNNGTILVSISGNMWTKIASGTTANLNDVYFLDGNNAFICGDNGTILYSNSSFSYWYAEQANTTANLKGIHGFGASDIWICGANGTILHRNLVSGISNGIAAKKITANFYPNPASSNATLQISGLKEKSGAKVQILNMLGQVVQQYEIWNELPLQIATNSLTAGNYLYKVISLEDQSVLTGKLLVNKE